MVAQTNAQSAGDQCRYLSVREAAAQLGIGANQILAHIQAGNLAAIDTRKPDASRPLFRIRVEDLERWVGSLAVSRPQARVTRRRAVRGIPKHIGN